jgi:hypothetical protein
MVVHRLGELRIPDRDHIVLAQKSRHKESEESDKPNGGSDFKDADARAIFEKLWLHHPDHVDPLSD